MTALRSVRTALRLLALAGLLALGSAAGVEDREQSATQALVVELQGPIGPATSEFVIRQMDHAQAQAHPLLILRMDTPGGLDASMREIIRRILSSRIPIVVYVAPEGARAASAGTYILYASHVAAMAPATNLGAATPVAIGGGGFPGTGRRPPGSQPPDDEASKEDEEAAPAPLGSAMERKVVHDAAAYIRGLAKLRGRNAQWAERAVREGVSLTAEDALAEGVIEIMARDLPSLIEALDGRNVTLGEREVRLDTAGLALEVVKPDWISRALALVTNPNIAYVLMLLGIYGLFFELANPGAIFPGVFGAVSLLIALYALHLLPVNYAGLALVVLGIGLMVAEVFAPSFGALGIGGIAAFVVGSLILVDTDVEAFTVSIPLVVALAVVSAGFFILVTSLAVRQRGKPVVSGIQTMVGDTAEALSDFGGPDAQDGYVLVDGERWHATSAAPVVRGAAVRIRAVRGLTLEIEPLGRSAGERPSEQEAG